MNQDRLKGYGLTYLGWFVASAFAATVSYFLTHALFKDAFPTWADFSRYQEGAIGTAVVVSLGAIVVFIVAFELTNVVCSILALQTTLKNYPMRRKATIAWLSVLSLLAPAVLVIDSMFGLHYWLIFGWLLLIPLLSRFIATGNR